MDAQAARIEALQANIRRYSQLLTTQLTDVERTFIQRRAAEDRVALEGSYVPSLPEIAGESLALRSPGA
jgi:hypothetical protein